MADYSIKIDGLKELGEAAHKAGGEMERLMYQTMVKATTLVQEEAKRISVGRFKNRTGNLRRSISRRVESSTRGVVGTGEKYAPYVEYGTGPHTIVPKNGRFLAFKADSGKMIFARKINHPGSKPYPYMEPAFRKNEEPIFNEYKKMGELLVSAMAK